MIVRGIHKKFIVARIWVGTFFFVLKKFPDPRKIAMILKRMNALKNRFTIDRELTKLARVDGRYFFNINNSGWPAKHFWRLVDLEAKSAFKTPIDPLQNIRMVLIALTKKCPLNCEHCYESEELNKKDTLSLEDHKRILKKFQDAGISQFQFGGGEPLVRVNDLLELLNSSQKSADFWISTSGFNLTKENAFKLKAAGLTGVAISLDHHDAHLHNIFRRNDKAYSWVEEAAKNATEAKLVIALSICVTKAFCTEENLLAYMEKARSLNASFVQLLEPRSVGNYSGMDVSLKPEHEKILEDLYFKMNNDPAYGHMPIVIYHGYRQRLIGCAGAGSRYLYVDTDGYMNSCPFCRNKSRHVLEEDTNSGISDLLETGCGKFKTLKNIV